MDVALRKLESDGSMVRTGQVKKGWDVGKGVSEDVFVRVGVGVFVGVSVDVGVGVFVEVGTGVGV